MRVCQVLTFQIQTGGKLLELMGIDKKNKKKLFWVDKNHPKDDKFLRQARIDCPVHIRHCVFSSSYNF